MKCICGCRPPGGGTKIMVGSFFTSFNEGGGRDDDINIDRCRSDSYRVRKRGKGVA